MWDVDSGKVCDKYHKCDISEFEANLQNWLNWFLILTYLLLLPVIFCLEVELCLCGYLLLVCGKKTTFLLFLGCSFSPCVGVFHLFSFVGLDLWKDIV